MDANALPANAMEHVVYIGLRNILMDSHASVTTDEPDYVAKAEAMAQKKLEALLSGEVRVASTRTGDPVKAEALRMAIAIIKSALRAKGRKADDKAIRAAAEKLLEKTPAIMEKARERVAETKALGDVEIDI